MATANIRRHSAIFSRLGILATGFCVFLFIWIIMSSQVRWIWGVEYMSEGYMIFLENLSFRPRIIRKDIIKLDLKKHVFKF